MTVYELIEELKKYPPEMRIVAPGYEGGCDDITGCLLQTKIPHFCKTNSPSLSGDFC